MMSLEVSHGIIAFTPAYIFFIALECSILASLRICSSALSSPNFLSYLTSTSLLLTPPEAGGRGAEKGGRKGDGEIILLSGITISLYHYVR